MSLPLTFGSSSSFSSPMSSSSSSLSVQSVSISSDATGVGQEKKVSKEEEKKRHAESQISPVNEWLLDSIENDQPNSIEKALKAGADINLITAEGTPLCRAVTGKKEKAALQLLEHKEVDINLVDRKFCTPVELAATTGQVKLLKSLLEKRALFQQAMFNHYVQYCVDHYKDRPGDKFEEHNHAMLAHYVSRFTGTNVGELLAKDHNQERYVVHLYAFETAVHDQVPLVGWYAQEFLPLRIYSFFEILVKLKKGVIKPNSESSQELKFAQDQIENEILMARETLRTVQDRLAIEKFHEVAEKKESEESASKAGHEESESDEIELAKETAAKESSEKPESIEEKPIFNQLEDLYEVLAKRIIARISELKEGFSYPVSIGFKDHEIYLNFMRYTGYILVRLDNLGYGSHKHLSETVYNRVCIRPYQLHSVLISELKSDQDLIDYIGEMLKFKNHEMTIKPLRPKEVQEDEKKRQEEERKWEIHKEEQLAKIYDEKLSAKQSFTGDWPQTSLHQVQTGGNCVLESQQIGLFLRSYSKEFFGWLLNLERQCVVNHTRVKFAPKASEEKYWLEEPIGDETIFKAKWFFIFQPFSMKKALNLLFEAYAILLTGNQDIYANYQETLLAEFHETKKDNPYLMYISLDRPHKKVREPIFSLLKAYDEQNYAFLEQFKQKMSMQNNLVDISILLFNNVTEDSCGYESCIETLECIDPTDPTDKCLSFFQLIKGLLYLKIATQNISQSDYRKSREMLISVTEDKDAHVTVNFLAYYALGICGYHLKDYSSASTHLQHALKQLSLYKNLSINDAALYQQRCFTYLGYLSIEQGDWQEARKWFEEAGNVPFDTFENTGLATIDTYSGRSDPIQRRVQRKCLNDEIKLGLACIMQNLALITQLASEQKAYFENTEKLLTDCLSTGSLKLRKMVEEKLQEVQNQFGSTNQKTKGSKRKSDEMAEEVVSSRSSFSSSSAQSSDDTPKTKEPRIDASSVSARTFSSSTVASSLSDGSAATRVSALIAAPS